MWCVMCVWVFFFFKQKTAYEMRISDWSSDVCSSDLPHRGRRGGEPGGGRRHPAVRDVAHPRLRELVGGSSDPPTFASGVSRSGRGRRRSEERRVGEECVSTCRSRWSPDH